MTQLTSTQASDLFRQPPSEYLSISTGDMAYRVIGEGPDVVFVHGWPVSGATFRQLLPHLTPHVRCHIFDLVGAGQSRFEEGAEINLTTHIEGLRRAIDKLGLTSFAAVGHDSGGMMARHAFAGDSRLRSMALVNTEQSQGLHWRFKQFLYMTKIPGFTTMLGTAAMMKTLRRNPFLLGDCFRNKDLLNGEFEEFFLAPLNRDSKRLWAAGWLARKFDMKYIDELAEVHSRIRVPVKLIWGRDDPFFPLEWTREMVSTFPQASLHVIDNAKLFCHEERPKEVAQAMLPTLLLANLAALLGPYSGQLSEAISHSNTSPPISK